MGAALPLPWLLASAGLAGLGLAAPFTPGPGLRVAAPGQICCSSGGDAQRLLGCANSSTWERTAGATRIALITLATPEIYSYAAYTAAINAAYARTFGHSFRVSPGSQRLDDSSQKNLVWRAGNVATILDALEGDSNDADWLAYMDADAALVDFSADDALLAALKRYGNQETYFFMSRGELMGPGSSSIFNSGFALVRQHSWTLRFVHLWWTEIAKGNGNDQEALERLYRADALDAKSHVVILPMGTFYNEIGDPIAGPPQQQHVVHLAGVPSEVRQGVFGDFWRGLCDAAEAQHHPRQAVSVEDNMALPSSSALQTSYVDHLSHFVQLHSSEVASDGACGEMQDSDGRRGCLESAERLSFVLLRRGRAQEAVGWGRRALAGRQHHLGQLDEDTLASWNTLASALEAAGRLEEATSSVQTCLQGRRVTYGQRHRGTLLSEAKLGSLLRAQGRLEEAAPYLESAAVQLAEKLGPEHSSSLSTASVFASLRAQQGRHLEAASIYRSAAKAAAKGLGKDDIMTLDLKQGAVDMLLLLGKHEEASSLGMQLVKRYRSFFRRGQTSGAGNVVQSTDSNSQLRFARALETHAASISGVGTVAAATLRPSAARLAEALQLYEEASQRYAAALSSKSSQQVGALRSAAQVLQALGRLDEAEAYFHRAWTVGGGLASLSAKGSESRSSKSLAAALASTANNLAMLVRARSDSRTAEAESFLRLAMTGFQASSSSDGKDTAELRAQGNLADLLRARGRFAEALPLAEGALRGMEHVGTPADTLTAKSNFALLLHGVGRQAECEALYRDVLTRSSALYGEDSQEAASTRADLGELLRRLGRPAEAASLAAREAGVGDGRHAGSPSGGAAAVAVVSGKGRGKGEGRAARSSEL